MKQKWVILILVSSMAIPMAACGLPVTVLVDTSSINPSNGYMETIAALETLLTPAPATITPTPTFTSTATEINTATPTPADTVTSTQISPVSIQYYFEPYTAPTDDPRPPRNRFGRPSGGPSGPDDHHGPPPPTPTATPTP